MFPDVSSSLGTELANALAAPSAAKFVLDPVVPVLDVSEASKDDVAPSVEGLLQVDMGEL